MRGRAGVGGGRETRAAAGRGGAARAWRSANGVSMSEWVTFPFASSSFGVSPEDAAAQSSRTAALPAASRSAWEVAVGEDG